MGNARFPIILQSAFIQMDISELEIHSNRLPEGMLQSCSYNLVYCFLRNGFASDTLKRFEVDM